MAYHMVYYELLVISCGWRLGETGGQVQPSEGPGPCIMDFSYQNNISCIWISMFYVFKGKIKIPITLVFLHCPLHPVSILVCHACCRFPCRLAPGWLRQSLGWSEGGGKSHKHLSPCRLPALAPCSESGPVPLGYHYQRAAPFQLPWLPLLSRSPLSALSAHCCWFLDSSPMFVGAVNLLRLPH